MTKPLLDWTLDSIVFLPMTAYSAKLKSKPARAAVLLFNCSVWAFVTAPLWLPLLIIGLLAAFYSEV